MEFSEVESFIELFEAPGLPRERWTHAAHLTAGHWYAWRLGMPAALDEMRGRIRAHNESVGTPNTDDSGYHETITRLYLTAIDGFIAGHGELLFAASLRTLLASPIAARDWPFTHYSRERLLSATARREWLPPDLREQMP